jgi:nitroreductase
MIAMEVLEACVARARLAPSAHNAQPARWALGPDGATLFCDPGDALPASDPEGRATALGCGAALEAMVLALSAHGIGAEVDLVPMPRLTPGRGLETLAHLRFTDAVAEDPLHRQLEARFTWRGSFDAAPMELYGWSRPDARQVLDDKGRAWLAERNDWASLQMLRDRGLRHELLDWMRLSPGHPRAGLDGMDRAALNLGRARARALPLVFGPLWRGLEAAGLTPRLTAEAAATRTAPVIALFHRPRSEHPVESGRAYLRLCLEAAQLGMAGWPMAALSDHPATNGEICTRFGIAPDRRLIQAIRFGKPTGPAPPRARRPLAEVLVSRS